jgi:hypothetical protein
MTQSPPRSEKGGQSPTYVGGVWTAWVETGAMVAGLALLFIALGLILGRPSD